jgi:hypothetical protein
VGWLRDAMTPRYTSFPKLAAALIKQPCWPENEERKRKQLGNVLTQLDHGERASWLDKREYAVQALSAVLDLPAAELLARFREASSEPADAVRVPLTELRGARDLRLDREDLFPGVPQLSLTPAQWTQHWWYAPSGSGRTLVGRWLEVRNLARFIHARTWPEARAQLGRSGCFFVELEQAEESDQIWELKPEAALKVVIAAPFPRPEPPSPAQDQSSTESEGSAAKSEPEPVSTPAFTSGLVGNTPEESEPKAEDQRWTPIEPEQVESWLPALVAWVAARLPQDGVFDADRALDLLSGWAEWGLVDTPGAALSLCGMFDHWGADRLEKADARQAASLYLRWSLKRTDRSWSTPRDWMREKATEVMVALVRGMLLDASYVLHAPRPWKTWASYLPHALVPPPDADAARQILPETDQALGANEVQQLRSLLKPGPDGVLRTLVEAHLLEPQGEGRYGLRPGWLVGTLTLELLLDDLLDEGPTTWGQLLFAPDRAALILEHLLEQFQEGKEELAWAALKVLAPADPATVAAVEGCFLSLGLAVLQGAQVSGELLVALWRAQCELVVPRYLNEPLQPRMACGEAWQGVPILRTGTWYLACWALSEHLEDAERELLNTPSLTPWSHAEPPEGLGTIFSSIDGAVFSHHDNEVASWWPAAVELARRLLDLQGPCPRYPGRPADIVALQAPLCLVQRIEDGQSLETLRGGPWHSGWSWEVVFRECERRGLDLRRVVDALWEDYILLKDHSGGQNSIIASEVLYHRPGCSRPLYEAAWQQVSPELLRASGIFSGRYQHIPWGLLSAEHWRVFIEVWRKEPMNWDHSIHGWSSPWPHMPEEIAAELLKGSLPNVAMRELHITFWRRFPGLMEQVSRRRLQQGDARSFGTFIGWAPHDREPLLVKVVGGWLDDVTAPLSDEMHRSAQGWLRRCVARRGPAWRDAYALLSRLAGDPS